MGWVAALIALFLLFIFPRQMGYLFLLLVAIVGFFFLKEEMKERDHKSVSIIISYDLDNCSKDFPLNTRILNNNKKILNRVFWDISAKREGYSSDVLEYSAYSSRTSDKILKPGESYGVCYAAPEINSGSPPNLIWEAVKIRARFKE